MLHLKRPADTTARSGQSGIVSVTVNVVLLEGALSVLRTPTFTTSARPFAEVLNVSQAPPSWSNRNMAITTSLS